MKQHDKWPFLPLAVTVANLDKQSHLALCQLAKQWESVTDSLSDAKDNFWKQTSLISSKIHKNRP